MDAATYNSIEEAVRELNLDRRVKWIDVGGQLARRGKVLM